MTGHRRPRLPTGPHGLAVGPRVIETVRLAAEEGLSNQEIAERRHCSVHTVNNQLRAFYDFAKAAVPDDALWGRFRTTAQRRQGLPEIWRRVQPSLPAGDLDASPQPAPPVQPAPARRHDLPAARCRELWGRGELLDEMVARLRDPRAPRIVLLAAFGGYGKTEFARSIAERTSAEQVFGRVAWLNLKQEEWQFTLAESSTLPPSVEPSRAAVVRMLMEHLSCASPDELRDRLAGEAILLVVDNLETLPAAEREALVSDLHRYLGSGRSRAIVTSRADVVAPYLDKPAFGGLSPEASEALLRDEAARFPRARELQMASPEVIRTIWALTGGMPLALHLVVGQCQRYELSQILANLEEARAGGSDDALHRYLCAQAWRELGRPARALLAYLATATRAPQTSAQLLGVAPATDVRFDRRTLHRALGELTGWFLVERAEPREAGQEITYALHPLTRAFVLSPATRDYWQAEFRCDEACLRAAAAGKHEEILQRGLGRQSRPTPRDAALVARAVPDFLDTMRYYRDAGEPQRVLWYWQWLSGYLWRYGRYADYVVCDEYAAAAAEQLAATDPAEGRRLKAVISAELAFAHLELGEFALAERYVREAERLFRQLGDRLEVAKTLRYHANLRSQLGEYDAAEALCLQALEILGEVEQHHRGQRSDYPRYPAISTADVAMRPTSPVVSGPIHSLLGVIYLDQGKYQAARRALLTALWAARKHGEARVYWSLAPLLNLGSLYERQANNAKARHYLQRCIRLTADGTSPGMRAAALLEMARLVARDDDRERARDLAQEAARLYEAIGTYGNRTEALRFLETLERPASAEPSASLPLR